MIKLRQRTYLLAFLAVVSVFAGCKGESPTAPSPVTPPTTTSGTGAGTPPTNATVALSVSKADPQVNATIIVTATVTQNGQPVANGTAVEFRTTSGTFTDVNAPVVIKTTTNGIATANLTSATAGPATITATVNNVAKTTVVNFQLAPVTPPPPDLTPTITSVTPSTIIPAGGQTVTITGKNFAAPVKVLFDFGAGTTPKEAFVVSVTPTQIQVLSPAIDLGVGQQATAKIIVINQQGTPNEVTVTSSATITIQNTVLTPKITTVSPASGPIDGGTRVTIFGEGFQAPMQVFFGAAEVQVINVTFSQIIAITPAARDTAVLGSCGAGGCTGAVDIKVININSATTVTATSAFRYIAKMQITAAGPTQGLFTGGTNISIDGVGFNDPLAVSVAGFAAQVLKVSGSEVVVRTPAINITSCADVTGPIVVTNVDNGDSATFTGFTFRVPRPLIASINPLAVSPGGTVTVTIANSQPGINRFTINGASVPAVPGTLNPDGSQAFTLTVPTTGFTFTSGACTIGGVTGTQPQPTSVNVIFTNANTTCTDTATNGLTVNPPNATCTLPPQASAAPPSGATLPAGSSTVGTASATHPAVTVANASNPAGGTVQPLNLSAAIGGTNAADFTVAPASANNVPPGSSRTFVVTFTPSATGARTATLTITTNDPANPTFTYTLTGTGL